MMRAGTARRSAGSAVSRRRYAGLAIDCANPLIESARADALAVSARAMLRPRLDDPLKHAPEAVCRTAPNQLLFELMATRLSRVRVNIFG